MLSGCAMLGESVGMVEKKENVCFVGEQKGVDPFGNVWTLLGGR